MRYLGYGIRVPASWPVYDLRRDPRTCVRFDRHAVYLGRVDPRQRCPAHAAGRTEALLLEPLGARAAAGAAGLGLVAGPYSTRLARGHDRVLLTATWNRRPRVIEHALRARSLPGAVATVRATAAQTLVRRAHATALTKGLGFDACAAPSTAALSAWKSSPYRTVGIYLGGANMACAQPNLTASWVSSETAAGWRFIPTYVGLQASTASCGCATISPSKPGVQGSAAASDAITRARALGLGSGNPIYFDLEAYSPGTSATSAVLSFLAAWTSTLHAAGYLSGVYSSAAAGISDLVAARGSSFLEPDELWIAHWNGNHTAQDPYVPSGAWASHQRIHQYSGGADETYGGVTINVDRDYVDGHTAAAGSRFPDGAFVALSGTSIVYRITGGAALPVTGWSPFGGPQPVARITQEQFHQLSPVPVDGTYLVSTIGRIFRIAGGAPFPASSWAVFGGEQPSVTIDQWNFDNLANPATHLKALPASGTVVEGVPSHSYWQFQRAGRVHVSPTPAAVAVDDSALTPYAMLAAAPTPRCVVPRLLNLTISEARRRLAGVHCRVGRVRRTGRTDHPHLLRVSGQSPPARTSHPAASRIALTVR